MEFNREDAGHSRVATLDIETTHYKPRQGEVVSIGVGVHERGMPGADAEYQMFHRDGSGEAALIRTGLAALNDLDADVLTTFKGVNFDFSFLADRLALLDEPAEEVNLDTPETHVDLFADRKEICDRTGRSWPSLEGTAATYGYRVPDAEWRGGPVTNKRFGEELGPAVLESVRENSDDYDDLIDVVEHYLVTDLEANFAIYYGDIDEEFEPHHLRTN